MLNMVDGTRGSQHVGWRDTPHYETYEQFRREYLRGRPANIPPDEDVIARAWLHHVRQSDRPMDGSTLTGGG